MQMFLQAPRGTGIEGKKKSLHQQLETMMWFLHNYKLTGNHLKSQLVRQQPWRSEQSYLQLLFGNVASLFDFYLAL